jgi:alpha-L-arabinofuranosidase
LYCLSDWIEKTLTSIIPMRKLVRYDYAWSAMQPNELGIDEYLTLTRILGVEPYITVNTGLGDANSAAEEVSYVNGPASSEWGAKRAMNGHRSKNGRYTRSIIRRSNSRI